MPTVRKHKHLVFKELLLHRFARTVRQTLLSSLRLYRQRYTRPGHTCRDFRPYRFEKRATAQLKNSGDASRFIRPVVLESTYNLLTTAREPM